MSCQENCFNSFKSSTSSYTLPQRFTFPFYYQPDPLCVLAAQELQQHLLTQNKWQHNFGLSGNPKNAIGNMFGVLLVINKAGELGYLAAFSGKLAEKNIIDKFVPPVFDMLIDSSFFLSKQADINIKQSSTANDCSASSRCCLRLFRPSAIN